MDSFNERYGDLDALPTDPNERKRLLDAYQKQLLAPISPSDRGSLAAMSMGHQFRVPPNADWRIEPNGEGAALRKLMGIY